MFKSKLYVQRIERSRHRKEQSESNNKNIESPETKKLLGSTNKILIKTKMEKI